MHRLGKVSGTTMAWTALLLTATPAFGADRPPMVSAQGGLLTARVQLHEAYLDNPLVDEIRGAGYLTVVQREKVLDKKLPSDRALAAVDAMGSEGARNNAVDRFVTLGLQARLTLGLSGALKKRDVGVADLDARQALVLGWVRALSAGNDATVLTRKGKTLEQAGAVQLLEQAVKQGPEQQAAQVALAVARAAADPNPKTACQHAIALQKAARTGGSASIRLAAAERVVALAEALQKSCKPEELASFQKPVQLPPPLPEPPSGPVGNRPPQSTGLRASAHPFGLAFVVTAPVFSGWLSDPVVTRLAARTRLDEVMFEDVLKRDVTGDLAVAVLNASALMQRIDLDDNAEVAWLGVVRRHGLLDAPLDKQKALKIQQLTGPEAMALGYAYALNGRGLKPPVPGDSALSATPQQLFAQAKAMVPVGAVLGPLMWTAHLIDMDRATDLCAPMKRVDALRFVVNKGTLPEAARQALLQALATVEAQCQAAQAQGSARPAP
jgi:hypothetical protein